MINLAHHFLIAMPGMPDGRFKQAVIYICEHNENGVTGLIINKPQERITMASLLDQLKIKRDKSSSFMATERPILQGGPIAEDRGFVLHTPQAGFASSFQLSDECVLTTSRDILEAIDTDSQPENILIMLGYCSWNVGQLEQELRDNAWLTCEADNKITFHTPLSERWVCAAKKLGIDIRSMIDVAGHA